MHLRELKIETASFDGKRIGTLAEKIMLSVSYQKSSTLKHVSLRMIKIPHNTIFVWSLLNRVKAGPWQCISSFVFYIDDINNLQSKIEKVPRDIRRA